VSSESPPPLVERRGRDTTLAHPCAGQCFWWRGRISRRTCVCRGAANDASAPAFVRTLNTRCGAGARVCCVCSVHGSARQSAYRGELAAREAHARRVRASAASTQHATPLACPHFVVLVSFARTGPWARPLFPHRAAPRAANAHAP
jgi:hypothetical protein